MGNTVEDMSYGCIIGSFIGDSAGSLIEFIESHPSEKSLDEVEKMPGGGTHGNGPG